MSPQVAGWFVSALCMLVAYLPMQSAGVSRLAATCWASLFFFTPLTFLINSGASALLVPDLAFPLAFYAIATKAHGGRSGMLPWAALIVGAGILPFLSAISYTNTSTDILICFVNLYRVTGIVAVAIVLRSQWEDAQLPALLTSLMNVAIVIAGAMAIQAAGILDTNFFEKTWNSQYYESGLAYANRKFIVLGMFKAAQGIIWMTFLLFGFAMINHSDKRVARPALLLFLISVVPLVLTGSKTSILAAVVGLGIGLVVLRSKKLSILFGLSLIALASFVVYVQNTPESRTFVNTTLYDLIVSNGADVQTADSRIERYGESMEAIDANPLILVGIHSPRSIPYNTGYFHSEYVSVLMLGGVLALLSYLYFLARISLGMLQSIPSRPAARGAALVLIGNLVQGLTVAHLQPTFLFVNTAAIAACLYAVGVPMTKRRPSSLPTHAPAEMPAR